MSTVDHIDYSMYVVTTVKYDGYIELECCYCYWTHMITYDENDLSSLMHLADKHYWDAHSD